jgi:hypothetical protein
MRSVGAESLKKAGSIARLNGGRTVAKYLKDEIV